MSMVAPTDQASEAQHKEQTPVQTPLLLPLFFLLVRQLSISKKPFNNSMSIWDGWVIRRWLG